jgi:hypothetical protein
MEKTSTADEAIALRQDERLIDLQALPDHIPSYLVSSLNPMMFTTTLCFRSFRVAQMVSQRVRGLKKSLQFVMDYSEVCGDGGERDAKQRGQDSKYP